MSQPRPWPKLAPEHQWTIDGLEALFATTDEAPEELLERAKDLRAQADQVEFEEQGEVFLALAERFEAAAATRLAAK